MRGADVLVRTLEAMGTDTIFSLSGNQIMSVFDASLDSSVRLVHTRHEAGAAFMAEGHAQVTGGVGVALVTAGAGLGNAIAPLLTARASQTPLLLLSGDSPVGLDGQGAFQEMDQVALTASVTKLSRRVTSAATLAEDVREALEVARSGQPGPVHLSLPQDTLLAEVDAPDVAGRDVAAASAEVDGIIQALNAAERPLVLLGPELNATRAAGVLSGAGVPVVVMESPRGANDPALGAFGQVWAKADLVVVLGKPVDFSLRFGAEAAWPLARWITVHGEDVEVQRAAGNLGARQVSGTLGAPRAVAQALAARAGDIADRPDWCAEVAAVCALRPTAEQAVGRLDSAALCQAVNALVAPDAPQIFVMDGGEFGQWAQAMIRPARRIVNGVSGAIGGGICYAIGAKAAAPEAEVIALMGDGTAGFHLAEFETAVREGFPFVAVIGNDRRWNAEHELQRRNFGEDRTHSCTLSGARYDQVVAAMGGFGVHVTEAAGLTDALAEARASGRPACVNVEIEGLAAPTMT